MSANKCEECAILLVSPHSSRKDGQTYLGSSPRTLRLGDLAVSILFCVNVDVVAFASATGSLLGGFGTLGTLSTLDNTKYKIAYLLHSDIMSMKAPLYCRQQGYHRDRQIENEKAAAETLQRTFEPNLSV